MKIKIKKIETKNIPVYEHLEYSLERTSYADRLLWLEEANEFMWLLKKNKNRPNLPKK